MYLAKSLEIKTNNEKKIFDISQFWRSAEHFCILLRALLWTKQNKTKTKCVGLFHVNKVYTATKKPQAFFPLKIK